MPNEPKFYLTEMQELSMKQNLAAASLTRPWDLPDAVVVSEELLGELRTRKPHKKLHWGYLIGMKVYADTRLRGRQVVFINSQRLAFDIKNGFVRKVGGDEYTVKDKRTVICG